MDLEVDDILSLHEKKKKVDGKSKGDRTELNLCKFLSKHFNEEFSRALGSGSRWSQVGNLPEHAKKTLTGDLCVPERFGWVIESKGGYEDKLDLNNVCDGNIAQLDEFIEQVSRDSEYSGRKPILCWKRNRKPWLACIRLSDAPDKPELFERCIYYGKWVIVSFQLLLDVTTKDYWFTD